MKTGKQVLALNSQDNQTQQQIIKIRHMLHQQTVECLPFRQNQLDKTIELSFKDIQKKVLFSDITFGKRLDKGNFSEVFEGQCCEREVAIKRFPIDGIRNGWSEMFEQEIKILGELEHPNIVQFFGACEDEKNNAYCIVMEYMKEGNLLMLLREFKDLSWDVLLSLALDIANGLQYLHQEHIRHRDLKSANILLYTCDNQLHAKIGDFGMAIGKGESLDWLGRYGTRENRAPEAEDENFRFTTQADIYSFGVILQELAEKRQRNKFSQNDVPNFFKKLIEECCNSNSTMRPSAKEIVDILQDNLNQRKRDSSITDNRYLLLAQHNSGQNEQIKQENLSTDVLFRLFHDKQR